MSILKVLFLSAESSPLVKVGGLGDVVGSLPKALRALGHDVRVAIPHYGTLEAVVSGQPSGVSLVWDGQPTAATITPVDSNGVRHYLIGGGPIEGGRVYGSGIDEDGPKFIFFSVAALAALRALDWQPDVIHVHDYHPAAAIYWLATRGQAVPLFRDVATVLTIHNLPFQGNHAGRYLAMAGLAPSPDPRLPEWARDGLMALGIANADAINAVSPGYAQEILTEEFGAGLGGLLGARADRLSGILNGIDYSVWNPHTDQALAARYDVNTLTRRDQNKAALQKECGLPERPNAPLIGVVSRLDRQKGFDLVAPAMRQLLAETEAQFVLLGAGMPEIEDQFTVLAQEFPEQTAVNLRFDARLATRIYAGSEVFLMPSRYEPCGLGQIIALRYGAVPVVRGTGGLKDTVLDYNRAGAGTGFVFAEYSSEALLAALRRALAVFADKRRWRGLQRRGMRQDFSWTQSARQYVALYRQAIQWRRGSAYPESGADTEQVS